MIPVISSGLVEVYCMAEVMALDILCLLHIFHQNPMYLIPHVLGLFCHVGDNTSKVRILNVMYTFTSLVECKVQDTSSLKPLLKTIVTPPPNSILRCRLLSGAASSLYTVYI